MNIREQIEETRRLKEEIVEKAVRAAKRAEKKGKRKGYVYFMAALTQDGHLYAVKIGYGYSLKKRRTELNVGCPLDLRLIGYFDAGTSTEKLLHERFNHLRIRGEWFKPNKELLGYVKAVSPTAYKVDIESLHPL